MKVTYLDHMGTDLTVVNAARVSFGKTSDWEVTCTECGSQGAWTCSCGCAHWDEYLSKADQSLIAFLARGCTTGEWDKLILDVSMRGWSFAISDDFGPDLERKQRLEDLVNHIKSIPPHWTPFGHCQISLHLKVPFFVAAQIKKHQTGFVVNEVSRRYVDSEPEFYQPADDEWRKKAGNVKQGSGGCFKGQDQIEFITDGYARVVNETMRTYREMLGLGVCPEQARMVLPLSTYTEFWMTGSLFGWANLFNQRSDPHAQKETQEVARQIGEIIEPLYPVSWKELTR